MYKRFTDRARQVMQFAEEEARHFNHEYVGTEHILLALVNEREGVVADVLKKFDVNVRRVRLMIEEIVQLGPGGDQVVLGKLPRTPRTMKAINWAVDEARHLNNTLVGTEHLLLGLMGEAEGVAAQVLLNQGLQYERVRMEVLSLLGVSASEVGPIKQSRGFWGFLRSLFRRSSEPPMT